MKRIHLLLASAAALSGCAGTMSGIGGSGEYACTAPEGVSCMSVTGLNANVTNRSLPGMQPRAEQAQLKKGEKDSAADGKSSEAVAYADGKARQRRARWRGSDRRGADGSIVGVRGQAA